MDGGIVPFVFIEIGGKGNYPERGGEGGIIPYNNLTKKCWEYVIRLFIVLLTMAPLFMLNGKMEILEILVAAGGFITLAKYYSWWAGRTRRGGVVMPPPPSISRRTYPMPPEPLYSTPSRISAYCTAPLLLLLLLLFSR